MKKTIALALVIALCGGLTHADDKKPEPQKSEKAKKKEQPGGQVFYTK